MEQTPGGVGTRHYRILIVSYFGLPIGIEQKTPSVGFHRAAFIYFVTIECQIRRFIPLSDFHPSFYFWCCRLFQAKVPFLLPELRP